MERECPAPHLPLSPFPSLPIFASPGIAALVFLVACVGCASNRCSVPATSISPSICESPRSHLRPINLLELRLRPPKEYRLGPRDILAIFVEGAYGPKDSLPPINMPQQEYLPPATGYPVPVRDDGTISLPLLPSLQVEGMTITEAENRVRQAYTVERDLLPKERSRISVSLIRKRTYHVLVIRGDRGPMPTAYAPGTVIPEPQKSGYAEALELPAYENDVLHALVKTGGLPGVTAKDEVTVLRDAFRDEAELKKLMSQFEDPKRRSNVMAEIPVINKIPLKIPDGVEPQAITPADIVLGDGDAVVIESRDAEVFYTGGVLKGGQFPLPRDYDLDVLGAISMAGGSIGTAAGGTATSAGVVVSHGGGIFPPTNVTILRMENGRQVSIHVDLKRAVTNPRERVLIQPNNVVLLEYTTPELIGNLIINNTFVSFSFTRDLR